MNMQEIRKYAHGQGVPLPARVTKLQLIRSIQAAEGNFPCFATALDAECDQCDCLWRKDCFGTVKK